jgi:hypothetical protein
LTIAAVQQAMDRWQRTIETFPKVFDVRQRLLDAVL